MSTESRQLREACEKRRTYRKFIPESIPQETIEDWLLTASTAPSGANMQPWFFCVVTDDELKKDIRAKAEKIEETFYKEKISPQWREDLQKLRTNWEKPFLTEASCLIVIFKQKYTLNENAEKQANYYVNESVGLAMGHLINAIRHSGYSSVTYTPAPMGFLTDLFQRPEGETPVMILAVGKADQSYDLPNIQRKTLDEIAKFY